MLATGKELSPVTAAVVKLQGLAQRMNEPRFHFAKEDVDNVTEIMRCIQDLDAERQRAHDVLEAESIKANVLRHRLREYPRDNSEELEEAVRAARELNAEVINNLRKQIRTINESIATMMEKTKVLGVENTEMQTEKQRLQDSHDSSILKLNEVLAERARRTIRLNETRDLLKQANMRIVKLEEDNQHLHEDLIQERIDHRDEVKRLKKETMARSDKRDMQKVQNEQKKRELSALEDKVKDSDHFLVELRDSISMYESSQRRLEADAAKLEKELDDRIQLGRQLQQQLTEWEEKSKVLQDEFEQMSKVLKLKITAANRQNEELTKNIKDLNARKVKLQGELSEAVNQRDMNENYVKSLNEKLVEARRELNKRNEELGALKQAQMETEVALTELADQHNMAVVHLNRTIDEYREQLLAEKRAREEMQARKDELQRQIDEFQASSNKYLKEMNMKISNAKKLYEQYDKEIVQLQIAIKKHDQDTIEARKAIEEWQMRQKDTEQQLTNRILELETQLAELLKDNEEKQVKHDAKKVEVDEVDQGCDVASKTFEENKRIYIRHKNKKQSLEEQCAATNKEIEKLATPNAKLVEELEKNKQKTLDILKQHAEEKTTLEMQIYAITSKMKTVLEENGRFEAQNQKMEDLLKQLREHYDVLIRLKAQLRRDQIEHKHILMRGWDDDHKLNEAFGEAEQVLMKDFNEILGVSNEREKLLRRITDRLRHELANFAVDYRPAVEDKTEDDSTPRGSSAQSAVGSREASFSEQALPSKQLTAAISALIAAADSSMSLPSRLQPISEELEQETTTATGALLPSSRLTVSSTTRTKTRTQTQTTSHYEQTPLTEETDDVSELQVTES